MGNNKAFTDQIRNTFLFSDLTIAELEMLEKKSSEVKFKAGELIYKQESHTDYGYYLLRGFAQIFIDAKGQRNMVKIIKPNWFIGLLSVFSYDNHQFSASAIENCTIRQIKKEALNELLTTNQLFAVKFIKELSLLSTDLVKYLVLKYQKNVRGRLADILLHLSVNIYKSNSFYLTFTRKELGNFANTSTESIIRMLSDFRKSGLISFDHKIITINDTEALKRESEMGF